ncbi:MAG: DUF354 domain-containing protein [Candidatus Ranarchaeia archaeon]
MKVWVDINTPKQALFFKPIISTLQKNGNELLVTSRLYPQVNQMLNLLEIKAEIIGRHGGADLKEKLEADSHRILSLSTRITSFKPDILLSFVSPTAARVAFGLKIPHITCSDSPHSRWVSKLVLPLADYLMSPSYIPKKEWTKFGIAENKIIQYTALDQVSWTRGFSPDPDILHKLGLPLDYNGLVVTIRIEEAQASYLLNKSSEESPTLIPLVDFLIENYPQVQIFLLPRYPSQTKALRVKYESCSSIHIIDRVIDTTSLISHSTLFVGAGGTMNAEAVLLGTPAIMTFKDPLIVYKWLVDKNYLIWAQNEKDLFRSVDKILKNSEVTKVKAKKIASQILLKMDDPSIKIINALKEFKKQN